MAFEFRLLDTGFGRAVFNMGLDEAMLDSVSAGIQPPTLRFYAWEPAAVSIGYFQGLDEEVDREACTRRGVDIVRRITGGGAVFHQAEITYSIVIPESHPLAPRSILLSYERLCSGIVAGLGLLGVEASFAPINDIVTSRKDARPAGSGFDPGARGAATVRKISGNAQTRRRGCLLQHGTLLLDLDVDLMFELLRVPQEKARGRLIQDVKARVTSLRALLGRIVPHKEAAAALASGFAAALDLQLTLSEPSGEELGQAAGIAASRFGDPAWTTRR